jgi:hypothetical protein
VVQAIQNYQPEQNKLFRRLRTHLKMRASFYGPEKFTLPYFTQGSTIIPQYDTPIQLFIFLLNGVKCSLKRQFCSEVESVQFVQYIRSLYVVLK